MKIGELIGVANEEYRRVITHQIPVALLSVELDGEAANVTLGIGRAVLARDR